MAEEKEERKVYEEESIEDLMDREGGEQEETEEEIDIVEEELDEVQEDKAEEKKAGVLSKLSFLEPVAGYIPLPPPINYAVLLAVPLLLVFFVVLFVGGEEEGVLSRKAGEVKRQPIAQPVSSPETSPTSPTQVNPPEPVNLTGEEEKTEPYAPPPVPAYGQSEQPSKQPATENAPQNDVGAEPERGEQKAVASVSPPLELQFQFPLKTGVGKIELNPEAEPSVESPKPPVEDKVLQQEKQEKADTTGEKAKPPPEHKKRETREEAKKETVKKEVKEVKAKKGEKAGAEKPVRKGAVKKKARKVRKKADIRAIPVLEVQERGYFKTLDGLNYWEGDTYKGMEIVRVMRNYVVFKNGEGYVKMLLRVERRW